jgi:hypothetical protein
MDASGQLTGETKTVSTGSAAIDLRIVGLEILSRGPESAASAQLQSLSYPGGTGTFTLTSPSEFADSYAITGRFTVPAQPKYLAGAGFQLPGGLRLFQTTGDWLMGPLWNYKVKASDPTACFSGHTEEELSLELPAGKRLAKLPADATITDKHVEFTARWSVVGQVVTVKRAFKVSLDQPLCDGEVRKEAAKVLAAVRKSFNTAQLSLTDAPGT